MKIKKSLALKILCVLLYSYQFASAQNIGDPYPKPAVVIDEGIKLHDEENYSEAIKKYKMVHENDSFYALALYELALSYTADKLYEDARQAALKGLSECDGVDRDMLIQYGNILDYLGQSDSAIKVYEFGIRKYPYQYRFNYEKGAAYSIQKQWDSTLKYYIEALKINPYHLVNHYKIGMMAANANKPTLAILALNTYCLISNNGGAVLNVLSTMEKIANNEYIPDTNAIDEKYFSFADDLKDIDLIVHSKAALNNKYKGKVKLNYHIIKQLQVICEKLPSNYTSDNWLMNFYIKLYKSTWDKNMFEGCALHSFRLIESKDVQSQVKSKAKAIEAFQNYGTDYLNEYRDYKTILQDGKEKKIRIWFADGNIRAIGEENAEGKSYGEWTYYYSTGHISAKGVFENGLKTGIWNYYFENGKIKSTEEYKNGVNDGLYTKYHSNGAVEQTSTFKNDEYDGETILYNANGTILSKMQFKNGNLNGVRENFTELGLPSYSGETVDGIYQGWYKTYHTNGAVNLDTKIEKDEIQGEATYYYPDGKLKTKANYNIGKRHGEWTWYYKNGKVETTGNYINGDESGKWLYYYEDGTLEREEEYEKGAKKGILKYYDTKGRVYAELVLKNGYTDSYKYYDINGKVFAEAKTQGGKLNFVRYSSYRNKIREGQLVNGKEEGTWKFYYENGALQYEMPFSKGKENGKMTYYYKNGKINYLAYFVDGEREGFYQSFHMNGKLETEGYYSKGERYGPWDYYYANGKLETREFYMANQITGKDYEYNVDGTPEGYSVYKNDFFNNYYQTDTSGNVYNKTNLTYGTGKYKLIQPGKQLMLEATYKGGSKDSISISYFNDKNIRNIQSYKYGVRNGLYKSYNENGKLKSEGMYVDGDQEGEWRYYNEDGKMYRKANFREGEYHGPYFTYHSNGAVEIECSYQNGILDSTYVMKDKEGILMVQFEYEGGVLKSYTYLGTSNKLVPAIQVKNETVEIKAFYPSGKTSINYKVENGLIQGQYLEYYSNGQLYVDAMFKDGNYQGAYKIYYPNGILKRDETHDYDEEIGISKFYHENGKLSKEIPYLFGNIHGEAKYYDNTGKLIKKANYSYDNIVN
jgi:antitoxin component YwqK of YwqJK toxin-antitoxin module